MSTSQILLMTELELVIANYVRNEYEIKHQKSIPDALKMIIHKFVFTLIGCDLLTAKEDMDLFNILSTKLKSSIDSFTTLYQASKHNYPHVIFHELCKGKGPIIIIIENALGNVFGGYSSKPWPKCIRKVPILFYFY